MKRWLKKLFVRNAEDPTAWLVLAAVQCWLSSMWDLNGSWSDCMFWFMVLDASYGCFVALSIVDGKAFFGESFFRSQGGLHKP